MPKFLVEVCDFDCRIKYMLDEDLVEWREENKEIGHSKEDTEDWLFDTFEEAKQCALTCMSDELKMRAGFLNALIESESIAKHRQSIYDLDQFYELKTRFGDPV